MVERRGIARFAVEPAPELLVSSLLGEQDLERNLAARLAFLRQEHGAHSALADPARHAVVPDLRAHIDAIRHARFVPPLEVECRCVFTIAPMSGTANRRTLIVIYVVMALAVAIVGFVVISAGEELEAERPLAGGYDLAEPDPCLGASFDLRQSGEFVNIENADGSLGGSLRSEQGRLTGDVSCVGGETAELRGQVAQGELDRHARRPPDPGGAHPRSAAAGSASAGARVGRRRILRQPAFGVPWRQDRDRGRGSHVEALRGEQVLGEASYEGGELTGEVECAEGGPTPTRGHGKRTGPSSCRPARRHLTAEKQREVGEPFAAFFIAIAVVMLVARLFGMARRRGSASRA